MREGVAVLRELQRTERRQRILDAAEALVRETGGTSFTMVQLARRAKMSEPTLYNLFGTKGAILYALLNGALDELASFGGVPDETVPAVLRPIRAMENAASFFVRDPGLLRPLYKYQLGEYAREERPAYMRRALAYWRQSLDGLLATGVLSGEPRGMGFAVDDLAMALLAQSIGLLDLWVQGELADDEFRQRMMLSAACIVSPASSGEDRLVIEQVLCDLREAIPPKFAF